MIFRLVEGPDETTPKVDTPEDGGNSKKSKAVWPPTRKILDEYNKLKTTDQQTNFLKRNVLPHPVFKKISGIRTLVIDCIRVYGLDPRKNPFLNLVTTMNISMPTTKSLPNMEYVYAAFKSKKLDMNMPVLKNPSLYQRNLKDFKYTVNAFWMMSDKKNAKKYLKNTDNVNVQEFLLDGTDVTKSTIKEAGIDGREGDTIFNVIEGWAKGNEYSPDEIAQNKDKDNKDKDKNKKGQKYVLEDVIPVESWNYSTFKNYITQAFKHKGDLKISSTKEECLEKVYIAFEYPNLVSSSSLTSVQNTKNKVNNKTVETVSESDIKVFGDPVNKPDVPIPVKLISNGSTNDGVSGVFLFHKFLPLTKETIPNIKQLSAKYLRAMGVKSYVGSNDQTLSKMQGLITILEQVS